MEKNTDIRTYLYKSIRLPAVKNNVSPLTKCEFPGCEELIKLDRHISVCKRHLNSKYLYCLDCGTPITRKAKRCKSCCSTGSLNWKWETDRNKVNKNKRYPTDYYSARSKVLKRDNHSCQNCFNTSLLHIHHIDKDINNNSPDNLITLCESCHQNIHYPHMQKLL